MEENSEKTQPSHYTKLLEFESKYRIPEDARPRRSITSRISNSVRRCDVTNTFFRYFPITKTLINYDVREYLLSDVISGLIVGIIMIPQCMAYAALSTLPHIVGLYIAFFSSIIYFIFGTTPHLSWGCVSIVGLLTANLLYKYDHSEEGVAFIKDLNLTYHHEHNTLGKLPEGHTDLPFFHGLGDGMYAFSKNVSVFDSDELEDIIIARRVEIACGSSLIAGLIAIAASQIGLSRITAIMSTSLITGFTVGIAFHVVSSQLDEVFGINVGVYKGTGHLFRLWYDVILHLPETNMVVFLLTLTSMMVIYVVKKFVNDRYKQRMRIPIPIELVVVVVSILVSYFLHLHRDHGVVIVGKVPVGIPKPKIPDLSLVTDYIGDALVILIVAHAQSLAMSKTFAMEHDYPIDPKQEMFAVGMATSVCGLFSSFTPGASVSRSLVQSGSGGKTQVTSIVAAGLVLLMIMVIGPYFYYLPDCVMSAIILVSVRGMFLKLLTIPREWRKCPYDCSVWVFTCVVTIILDTGVALLVSVAFSMCLVIVRQMMNPIVEIGRIQNSDTESEFRSLGLYYQTQKVQNVQIIKVKIPLYFLNCESFTDAVFEITRINPIRLKSYEAGKPSKGKITEGVPILFSVKTVNKEHKLMLNRLNSLNTIVLDISEVSFLDSMAVQSLDFLVREFQSVGVGVLLCAVPETVFGILESTGFWATHGDRLFLSVQSALSHLEGIVDTDSTETQDSMF